MFTQEPGSRKFIGTVGELQFEVLQYRLEHEYGAKCRFEHRNIHKACWLHGAQDKIDEFTKFRQNNMARDKDGKPVFLAETAFILQTSIANNPDLEFKTTSEVMAGS